MDTINVTLIEPKLKHPTIFNKFDEIGENESFIIHNDHDPKPLYYQLIAERGQTFEWEYLLNGPEIWEVKISKLTAGEKPKTVGEMVLEDYRKAEVFRKFGIDFCCGGKKTLQQACEKKGINPNEVQSALENLNTNSTQTENYHSWSLDFLADYIVNKHHTYVKESHSILFDLSQKVARVHGDKHPELIEIAHLYEEIANELQMHMHKEEMILFPYIKKLVLASKNEIPFEQAPFGSIVNPINMMESEHELAGEHLEKIHEYSNNYTPPADACNSYRVLFAKLSEYEKDLHQHIHLENNLLFPKAIELEKSLNQ
ncbi:MAG: iron-sulfur cluster repair di-iron protein [Flavobacteriia bacterium]|nr:iron-sulfur cluster repair di-iron protein [Flavobacteriia bacterium]